ncbi:YitT family protein [Sporomusa aerivorans]|uniref:YczE/YyaS/YitT family protein n=1 Tax=Sporomusa aerivorans TaxID=204936 RepID=UPI00352A4F7F
MLKRLLFLFWGLFLFALGIVLTVNSNLGTAPWDVLHLGLTNYLPFTMGQVSQLTGIIVIMASWLLGVKPGWGSLANMYFIGLFIDMILAAGWIPVTHYWLAQLVMLLAGVWLIGWASYFYLSAAFGAGPRDSFMVAAVQKTGWSVWKIRTGIETSVAALGYFLGGPIGVGTLIIAFTLGPSIQWAFNIMGKRAQDIDHDSFIFQKKQAVGESTD